MDFVNLKKQYKIIKKDLDKDLLKILNDCNFILGDQVYELEKKLADYVGVKECITCASGTDALLIPLMANNIGSNDVVFTTNFSYFATAEVISLVGAKPAFIDIDEKNYNLNPDHLEEEIKNTLKEGNLIPKAIIAVDLFGHLADYSKIKKIAKKYNLLLIEDAAQSFGAKFNDKLSCSFGDVAATSFYPSKPLGCYGDGGAIFTNDKKMANLFRSIRVHGQGQDKYDNIRIGLNSRLDTLQAAVLLNKLKIYDSEIEIRNEIADFYTKKLSKYLITPKVLDGYISSWAQYSVRTKNKNERDSLIDYLSEENIPTSIFYKNIFSNLNIYKQISNVKNFKISKKVSDSILSIPMNPYLTKNDLYHIVDTISNFYEQ